jgi:DNA-binding protein HU-beta
MNKAEFVTFISEIGNCSKADATRALDMITESVTKALGKGNEVSLVGFGSFYVQRRAAREGRNPKTGAKMHIQAYKQPAFRAGKKLKESCNGN